MMLRKAVDEILFDGQGKVVGVRCGEEVIKASKIICHPYYTRDIEKVRTNRKIVRAVCVLNHKIVGLENNSSAHIVIPQSQTGRNSEIYVNVIDRSWKTACDECIVTNCSTEVESSLPEIELEPAFQLVGDTLEKFVQVFDVYEACEVEDCLYVTKSDD